MWIGVVVQARIPEALDERAGPGIGAVVADEHLLADVGVVSDATVASDDGRAFDHSAVLDYGARADVHLCANECVTFALIVKGRLNVNFNIVLDLLQRFPGELATVENRGVFRLRQVEQVRGLEHVSTLAAGRAARNAFLARWSASLRARGAQVPGPC